MPSSIQVMYLFNSNLLTFSNHKAALLSSYGLHDHDLPLGQSGLLLFLLIAKVIE